MSENVVTVGADRNLEENLGEAATLSRALWMLMTGLIGGYPHAIEKKDLLAVYQLATEVRDRADAANEQWHNDSEERS